MWIFCKVNFELIKHLYFYHMTPSSTAHLCPSSHSIPFAPINPQEATVHPCLLEDALPAPQTSELLAWPKPTHFSWPSFNFNREAQMQWQGEVPKHPSFFPSITHNLFALDQIILPLKIQIHWIPLCPCRVYCLLEPPLSFEVAYVCASPAWLGERSCPATYWNWYPVVANLTLSLNFFDCQDERLWALCVQSCWMQAKKAVGLLPGTSQKCLALSHCII